MRTNFNNILQSHLMTCNHIAIQNMTKCKVQSTLESPYLASNGHFVTMATLVEHHLAKEQECLTIKVVKSHQIWVPHTGCYLYSSHTTEDFCQWNTYSSTFQNNAQNHARQLIDFLFTSLFAYLNGWCLSTIWPDENY